MTAKEAKYAKKRAFRRIFAIRIKNVDGNQLDEVFGCGDLASLVPFAVLETQSLVAPAGERI